MSGGLIAAVLDEITETGGGIMSRKLKRIFYVPNESGDERQFGIRRAFSDLLRTGILEEVEVFSLQWRIRNSGSPEDHRQDLIRAVRRFRPDILFMQHLGGTGLRARHFAAMRVKGNFSLLYYEGDPFTRIVHPLPSEARLAGKLADVVYTVGSGTFMANFRAAGSQNVKWEPSAFDPGRYGRIIPLDPAAKPYDVAMIANRNRPRLRGLPNWRDRIEFVEYMQSRFGDRFAIFGRGWVGPTAKGPIDYSQQGRILRSAWVSTNWDHFASEPMYFSDRLAISLAEASVHATTRHPGYAKIFGEPSPPFLLCSKSRIGLADQIERYLRDTPLDERLRAGRAAQRFAHARLRQDNQLVRMLNAVGAEISPEAAASAWDVNAPGLSML